MRVLEDLIKQAEELYKKLESATHQNLDDDVCVALDAHRWEVYKMANHIREIQNYYGG